LGGASEASSHISFAEQLDYPQSATRMSQIVPQQNLRTMAELDKEAEIRLANVHRRCKQAANRLTMWWDKKLGK
jgi:transcriptional regulator NrdR family protein